MRSMPTFAADGSEAVRHFSNGLSLVVAQALLVGPGVEAPIVEVRFVPSHVPETALSRFRGLLMRSLEVRVALEHARRLRDAVLCLDGSLQTPLPHLIFPLREIPGEESLPFQVLDDYLELFEVCRANGILLLGVAKTTSASFLTEALWRLQDDSEALPAETADERLGERAFPTDSEVLYRFAEGPGFSHPLLLGSKAMGHRWRLVADGRTADAQGLDDEAEEDGRDPGRLERLARAPAIVAFHVRLRAGEEPMRVDVPASCLGLPDRLCDLYTRWAPVAAVEPVLRQVRGGYGGSSVYNSALYVADRLVRLSQNLVDGPYLSMIREALGQYVQYDRSRRRFL